MTRECSGKYNLVHGLDASGNVETYSADNDNAVRATFNLLPSVTYKSGSRTLSDPIIIN